jgi:F1F0 ATPase subunit 2
LIAFLELAAALFAGALLGAFFFGGLWWTVRKGLTSSQPALFFLGSLLLRTFAVVIGFYFVSQGDWRRLAISLAGFVLARIAIRCRVDSSAQAQSRMIAERVQ